MIDKASSKRFEGWPLDSLSINKENGKYFVDGSIEESKENIIKDQYQKSVVDFLIKKANEPGKLYEKDIAEIKKMNNEQTELLKKALEAVVHLYEEDSKKRR